MFVNIFSLPFSEQWNEAYSAQCYAVINHFNQHPRSQCLRWPGARCWAAHVSCVTCRVSHVHTLAYPTVRRNIRYLIFIIRVHYVLHTIQSHSAGLSLPLVCVPEEYTMRGEVRREEVADLLASMIQTLVLQQQLMAASLGPGHAQAVARAGTLKTSTYCWMKRR